MTSGLVFLVCFPPESPPTCHAGWTVLCPSAPTCSSALYNVRHISVSSPAPANLSVIHKSSAGVCWLTSTSKQRSLYLGPSDDAMQKMGFHESKTLFYHHGLCQPPLKGRLRVLTKEITSANVTWISCKRRVSVCFFSLRLPHGLFLSLLLENKTLISVNVTLFSHIVQCHQQSEYWPMPMLQYYELLFGSIAWLIVFFDSKHAHCQLSLWVPGTLHNI